MKSLKTSLNDFEIMDRDEILEKIQGSNKLSDMLLLRIMTCPLFNNYRDDCDNYSGMALVFDATVEDIKDAMDEIEDEGYISFLDAVDETNREDFPDNDTVYIKLNPYLVEDKKPTK